MLKHFLLTLFLFPVLYSFSQEPVLVQSRCFGGSSHDAFIHVDAKKLAGSGLVVITSTNSTNGDVSGLHYKGTVPYPDMWVVKLTEAGDIAWQKCLGGTNEEEGQAVDVGAGNSIFVAGTTHSNDGDVIGNRDDPYDANAWVVKLDENGKILWQKVIGGTDEEYTNDIKATSDGGCLVVGATMSSDGEATGHHGGRERPYDAWAVKLDANGNVTWAKCYGSTKHEEFRDILETQDGGFILAGETEGNDGDVIGRHDTKFNDAWVVKIDQSGKILWSACYGGNKQDYFFDIYQAADGGLIFGGSSYSSMGPQVQRRQDTTSGDAYIVRTDANGKFLWGNCYGGSGKDVIIKMEQQGGSLLLAGSTESYDGDIKGPAYGEMNFWQFKIDLSGGFLWQNVIGGDKTDVCYAMVMDESGLPVLVGITYSNNGDVKGLHDSTVPGFPEASDIWYARFGFSNSVNLLGYADFNSNMVREINEPMFPYYRADIVKNQVLLDSYFAGNDTLRMTLDTGSYSIQLKSFKERFLPSTPELGISFSGNLETVRSAIAFQPAGVFNDLSVHILPLTGDRRAGRTNSYRLTSANTGTTTLQPMVYFVIDPNTKLLSSTIVPSATRNDTLFFTPGLLQPFQKSQIEITVQNDTTLLMNDTIRFTASTWSQVADDVMADNLFVLTEAIIGSFDPNDKTESHGGSITPEAIANGEYLNYLIRFQNTGNDTAFNISIRDTLSAMHDLATLQPISTSHPGSFELSGNVCLWKFNDINLVDSNRNEPDSHGYISFRIKPKRTLRQSDIISNKASIYFDYNPPVVTPPCYTAVKGKVVTGIEEPAGPSSFIRLYPNPLVNNSITIHSMKLLKGKVYMQLFNEAGVAISRSFLGTNLSAGFNKQVSLGGLPAGKYIVVISSDNHRHSSFIIKPY